MMDEMGEEIIKAINKRFGTMIEINEDNCKWFGNLIEKIAMDHIDEIVEGTEYGYCPDCDERMPDEPMRDESRD